METTQTTGTLITSAHVKVMLSHDYNHFESSMGLSNPEGLTTADLDNARKECQRLCSKAVDQYTLYKNVLYKNRQNENTYDRLLEQVERIQKRPVSEWSDRDKAAVKALEDWNWETRRRQYNYEDDFEYENETDSELHF